MSDAAADTATDATPDSTDATPDTDAATDDATDDATDWKAEAEKFKALARKHEDRAKANAKSAKELEELRQQSMTEQERAVEQAKSDARAEALAMFGTKLVDAEVRAAFAGRPGDVDALLEGIDRSRFVDDAGDPDRDAIAAWLDRVAPKGEQTIDLGQGARGGTSTTSDPLEQALTAISRR